MTFKTDGDEANSGADGTTNELVDVPSGTTGFSLRYKQTAC